MTGFGAVFSHNEPMLKEKPEHSSTDSWSKNLQGRGNQAGAAGLIWGKLEKPALKGRQTNEESIHGNRPPTGLQPSHLTLLFIMSGKSAQ